MAGSLRCLLCSHWILFQCLSPTCLQGALQTHLVFVYDRNMLLRVGWLTTKSRWVSKRCKLPVEMCTTVDSVSNLKNVSGTGNRSKSCVVRTRFSSIKPDWWGIPVYFRSAADLLFCTKRALMKPNQGFTFTVKDYLDLLKLFFILRQQMDWESMLTVCRIIYIT